MLEKDVVYGADDLAHVDEGVSLHVLSSLEFHVAIITLDLWRASAASFDVIVHRWSGFSVFPAFWTRDIRTLASVTSAAFSLDSLNVNFFNMLL